MAGMDRRSKARWGKVWQVWIGLTRCGAVSKGRYGLAGWGAIWIGKAGRTRHGLVRWSMVSQVRQGLAG